MNLAQLMELRPLPAAGLLISLTQRCPLHCAHCSTSSTSTGPDTDAHRLRRFVRSFTEVDRPQAVLFTGGEPLMRPELLRELAGAARLTGVRTAVLSGLFFARQPAMPARIRAAISTVDHFSASIDAFHEREVPRQDVFRTLRTVLDDGIPVSLHLTGTAADRDYLDTLTREVRDTFGDAVPMLVNEVRPVGRAAAWATRAHTFGPDGRPLPCAMAAWPVIAPDGTVLACCNQETVERRPVPEHLRLGHLAEDDWPAIRERALTRPVLRMIRAVGPAHLHARYGGSANPSDYCDSCRRLGDHPAVLAAAERDGAGAVGELLDLHVSRAQFAAGPAALLRRFGDRYYADLVGDPNPVPR